ncbi:unnamed protein product [Polarella glacialis]|uniref:Uncharacterized protein n=1 Tax=Polarella glacialis TaxID=89957 RepID=A0A813F312_POLGL|nr:unnamed protein product [Polarella glacialis]
MHLAEQLQLRLLLLLLLCLLLLLLSLLLLSLLLLCLLLLLLLLLFIVVVVVLVVVVVAVVIVCCCCCYCGCRRSQSLAPRCPTQRRRVAQFRLDTPVDSIVFISLSQLRDLLPIYYFSVAVSAIYYIGVSVFAQAAFSEPCFGAEASLCSFTSAATSSRHIFCFVFHPLTASNLYFCRALVSSFIWKRMLDTCVCVCLSLTVLVRVFVCRAAR